MARLTLSLLGALQITVDGRPVNGFAYNKARALLAYLVSEAHRLHHRDALVGFLENRGIETRPLVPLTNQPYMKALFGADLEDRYPVAKMVNETGFYIGVHQYLSMDDLSHMDKAFHDFWK